ncbi:MAG: imidazolonepropionase [Acidilobus sp.]
MPRADLVIIKVGKAVTFKSRPVVRELEVDVKEEAELAIRDGMIVAVGQRGRVRGTYEAGQVLDAEGRLVTPGLVDMHTHAIFAGSRDDELELRLRGVTYSEILRRGGGIYRTVRATRSATDDELLGPLLSRLSLMIRLGTTTVEVKSGYSLDVEGEERLLRVINEAARRSNVTVIPTLLAHVPPEDALSGPARETYVKSFVVELIPRVSSKGLARYVDVFCDQGAFTPEETRLILKSARESGLGVRVHADQLARVGCTRVAAELRVASADHLEVSDESSVRDLAQGGVIAGLLPASQLATFGGSRPPVKALRRAGVPMALGTDLSANSLMPSMQTTIDLAIYLYGLTPLEAIAAATVNAALSLGLDDRGVLGPGYLADLVVWDLERPTELGYEWGWNRVITVIKAGRVARGVSE